MIASTSSFPVPTPANPGAMYEQTSLRKGKDEEVRAADARSKLEEVKAKLAAGRNDNHAAVMEEHARRTNKEQVLKEAKVQDAKNDRAERQKELEVVGVPAECAYLMDTASYARRASTTHESQEVDADLRAYENGLKRVLASQVAPGVSRLVADLEDRAAKQAKTSRGSSSGGDSLHISKANETFNRSVGKSLKADKHTQTIKQSLERGTAI